MFSGHVMARRVLQRAVPFLATVESPPVPILCNHLPPLQHNLPMRLFPQMLVLADVHDDDPYQRPRCIGRQGNKEIGLSQRRIVTSLRAMGQAALGHGTTGHATHGLWLRA